MNRLLSKLHLIAKIALFGIFAVKFFDHVLTHALKIFHQIYTEMANFTNQSKFRMKSNKQIFNKYVPISFFLASLSIPCCGLSANQPAHLTNAPAQETGKPAITTPQSSSKATNLLKPIDTLLRTIRDGDIVGAYNSTSKDFKNSTTLQEFETFVARNPILKSHKNIQVKPSNTEGNQSEVTVILNPEKDALPVVFLLIQEEGQWKIWNMAVTPLYSSQVTALMKNLSSMQIPIENQLKAIKEDNILKAYQEFTSKQFQKETPLAGFRTFLKNFPILKNYSKVEFKEPVLQEGTGQIEVLFHSVDHVITQIDYTLGIEDDQWKIWGLQIIKQSVNPISPEPTKAGKQNSPNEQPHSTSNLQQSIEITNPQKVHVTQEKKTGLQTDIPSIPVIGPMEFAQLNIGSKSNYKENALTPSTMLNSNQGDIYIDLSVRRAQPGVKVDLHMQHLESNSEIPEISTTIEQEGDITISYVISPPALGWPMGHYLIKFAASNGIQKNYSFRVE